MEEGQRCLKRLESEDDEAIAHSLAAALCEDDVETFLRLYDEIPPGVSLERLGNIKEMARQVAALTRNSSYRHTPIPVKDSTFFGINHTLQTTPLTLNGQLNTSDLSAFKTPPEGRTPVDQKHFDYNEEALKTISLSLYEKPLNDSGVVHPDYLDHSDDETNIESHAIHSDAEGSKMNDDEAVEFHTPPEFQDDGNEGPPFGYPPSSDKLINSVINLLSTTTIEGASDLVDRNSSENCSNKMQVIPSDDKELVKAEIDELCEGTKNEQSSQDTRAHCEQNSFENARLEMITVNVETDCLEKDSLDGSPYSRKSFTQEEDDSGISIVDENDVLQESMITNGNHFESKREEEYRKRTDSNSDNQRTSASPEKKTYNSESELKHTKSNSLEAEPDTSVGWQTKRMNKKRHHKDFERNSTNYHDSYTSESRSNHKEPPPRRSGKNRDKCGKTDKSESKTQERNTEEKYKERNAWTMRRSEESELNESPKRPGRRAGQVMHNKRSDNKWARNGGRERYPDLGKHESVDLRTDLGVQPSVFSYRDALLKAGSKAPTAKGQLQTAVPSKPDRMFELESAVNYLFSAWTSVNNLHKKDPSKVFFYNGD